MRFSSLILIGLLTATGGLPNAAVAQQEIEVPNALLKIIETVNVPAERAGVLQEVNAKEGKIVQQGEQVAHIRDNQARLRLEQAATDYEIAKRKASDNIDVRYAEKSLEVAKAELQRALDARAKIRTTVSQSELDRLNLIVDKTALEIERAKLQLDVAQLTYDLKGNEAEIKREDLERHQITAPIAGMIVGVEKRAGEWVEVSDTVFRIVRIDRLRVEGFVTAEQATLGLEDCEIMLTLETPGLSGRRFPGKIVFVSPDANPVNGSVRVWAEIDNSELRLRPGLRATMTISLESSDQ